MKLRSLMFIALLLAGSLVTAFSIRPVKASGTIYIRADGSIDPPTAPIQRNGDTYTLTGNITSDSDGIVIERDNIVLDGAGYTVTGSGSGSGTTLSTNISDVTVRNMMITNFADGIYLISSSNCTLSGNNVTANSSYGIELDSSSGNTLSGNNVANKIETTCGVWLYHSSDNSVNGNNMTNNRLGIALTYSSSNSVSVNNMSNNVRGIYLCYSGDNNVDGNTATGNVMDGIALQGSCYNNVSGNTAAYNSLGISLVYSSSYIRIYSSNNTVSGNNITANEIGIQLIESSDNKFYHNNIDNNSLQVSVYRCANVWDDGYPSGGNYWSDYLTMYPNASEVDSLGVWDTPYVIDTDNIDNYPLVYQVTVPEESTQYSVTFTETGLPSGTSWSVALNGGTPQNSTTNTITFTEPNGVYSYTISYVPVSESAWNPFPNSGSITVNEAPPPPTSVEFTFESPTLSSVQSMMETPSAAAPTGIACYGFYNYSGEIVPYTISTDEVVGYANIAELDIPLQATLQLNVMLQVTTNTNVFQYYWLQNVIQFEVGGYTFWMNVFNSTPSQLKSNLLYQGLSFPQLSSWPMEVLLIIKESIVIGGVEVAFSYQLKGQTETTFWTVTIANPDVQSASIIVSPYTLTPSLQVLDSELVWGGGNPFGTATFNALNAKSAMFYMSGSLEQLFPSLYTFGLATAETATNLQVSLAPDGDALVTKGTTNNAWLTNSFNPSLPFPISPPSSSPFTSDTMIEGTSIISGSASADETSITDVNVIMSGSSAPDGTELTVISTNYGTTLPSGMGTLQDGDPHFYDVQVSSSVPLGSSATAAVYITNPDFNAQNSAMSYWDTHCWVPVSSQFIAPDTVCGNFSISDLMGTPIMVMSSSSVAITFDQSGVSSGFTGTVAVIDGFEYNASALPLTFIWQVNSLHTFAFQSPLMSVADAAVYYWANTTGLSSSRSASTNVTTSGSIVGNYETLAGSAGGASRFYAD